MYKRRKLLKFFIGQFRVRTLSFFSKSKFKGRPTMWKNLNICNWIKYQIEDLFLYICPCSLCCSNTINLHYKIQSWQDKVWLDQHQHTDWWIFFGKQNRNKHKPTLWKRQCIYWRGTNFILILNRDRQNVIWQKTFYIVKISD